MQILPTGKTITKAYSEEYLRVLERKFECKEVDRVPRFCGGQAPRTPLQSNLHVQHLALRARTPGQVWRCRQLWRWARSTHFNVSPGQAATSGPGIAAGDRLAAPPVRPSSLLLLPLLALLLASLLLPSSTSSSCLTGWRGEGGSGGGGSGGEPGGGGA